MKPKYDSPHRKVRARSTSRGPRTSAMWPAGSPAKSPAKPATVRAMPYCRGSQPDEAGEVQRRDREGSAVAHGVDQRREREDPRRPRRRQQALEPRRRTCSARPQLDLALDVVDQLRRRGPRLSRRGRCRAGRCPPRRPSKTCRTVTPCAGPVHDGDVVAGEDGAFAQHPEVSPDVALLREAPDPVRLIEPGLERRARHCAVNAPRAQARLPRRRPASAPPRRRR